MPSYESITALPVELHNELVSRDYYPDELGDIWVMDDEDNESAIRALCDIMLMVTRHGHSARLTDVRETEAGVTWAKVSVRRAG